MSCLLIGVCLFLQIEPGSVTRLYPIDETARDSSFRSYVGKLRSAVENRNSAALRRLVDEEVFVGPENDDKGWQKFAEKWRPDDRGSARLWMVLADLLSLGFIREHPNLFLSPYLVWRFPRDLNMATHLVVVRDKSALREAPSMNSPAPATLSFDIVRPLGPPEGSGELVQWVHVETLDGKTGYVNTRDLMSPVMPRVQFATRRGKWLLVALEEPE